MVNPINPTFDQSYFDERIKKDEKGVIFLDLSNLNITNTHIFDLKINLKKYLNLNKNKDIAKIDFSNNPFLNQDSVERVARELLTRINPVNIADIDRFQFISDNNNANDFFTREIANKKIAYKENLKRDSYDIPDKYKQILIQVGKKIIQYTEDESVFNAVANGHQKNLSLLNVTQAELDYFDTKGINFAPLIKNLANITNQLPVTVISAAHNEMIAAAKILGNPNISKEDELRAKKTFDENLKNLNGDFKQFYISYNKLFEARSLIKKIMRLYEIKSEKNALTSKENKALKNFSNLNLFAIEVQSAESAVRETEVLLGQNSETIKRLNAHLVKSKNPSHKQTHETELQIQVLYGEILERELAKRNNHLTEIERIYREGGTFNGIRTNGYNKIIKEAQSLLKNTSFYHSSANYSNKPNLVETGPNQPSSVAIQQEDAMPSAEKEKLSAQQLTVISNYQLALKDLKDNFENIIVSNPDKLTPAWIEYNIQVTKVNQSFLSSNSPQSDDSLFINEIKKLTDESRSEVVIIADKHKASPIQSSPSPDSSKELKKTRYIEKELKNMYSIYEKRIDEALRCGTNGLCDQLKTRALNNLITDIRRLDTAYVHDQKGAQTPIYGGLDNQKNFFDKQVDRQASVIIDKANQRQKDGYKGFKVSNNKLLKPVSSYLEIFKQVKKVNPELNIKQCLQITRKTVKAAVNSAKIAQSKDAQRRPSNSEKFSGSTDTHRSSVRSKR